MNPIPNVPSVVDEGFARELPVSVHRFRLWGALGRAALFVFCAVMCLVVGLGCLAGSLMALRRSALDAAVWGVFSTFGFVSAPKQKPEAPQGAGAGDQKGQKGEALPAPEKPRPRAPLAGDAPPPAAENRDPEKVFQNARAGLLALEAKHDLLKGASDIKPVVERDEKGRLKQIYLIFERNALPPGKGPAKAMDESLPFVYVSIQVWAGRTQQPPADLHEFEWKGQTYQMWVRVFGSDAKLVEAIRKAVDVTRLEPPEITFRLETPQSPEAYRAGKPLVFEGQRLGAVHRPGPEHFRLMRVADGKAVPLQVAYDREKVVRRKPGQERGPEQAEDLHLYNALFKGVRVFLFDGKFDNKDLPRKAGILDLYGCPQLETGVTYRLTWACWPVGASEAVEVSCEFALDE